MSQIDTAVTLSRRLESLLEAKYQATGKGLHEKVSSIEDKLPLQLVKSLRYIATMRNSVVHEEGFVIDDLKGFSEQGDAALRQLGGKPINSAGLRRRITGWLTDMVNATMLFGATLSGAILGYKWMGDIDGIAIGYFIGLLAVGALYRFWQKALMFLAVYAAIVYLPKIIDKLIIT